MEARVIRGIKCNVYNTVLGIVYWCTRLKLKPIKIDFIIIRGMLYATVTQDTASLTIEALYTLSYLNLEMSQCYCIPSFFYVLLFIKNIIKFLNIFSSGALPTYHNKYIIYIYIYIF